MARRNLLRSVLAASVMVVSGGGALLATAAAAPAGAVDNNRITVTVRDSGFSETNITARVGDQLIFVLDAAATQNHTLAWDRGQIQFKFDHNGNASKNCDGGAGGSGPYVCYPMNNHGQAHFYDIDHVRDPNGAAFAGTLTVTDAPPPPPDTTSSSTSTTVTTVRATTATTARTEPSTTTFPPTTATTGFVTVRPMLVSGPAPTTTTTAPKKKDASDNKDKGKAASPETPTTAAPAPPDTPGLEPVFDPATLTPAPLPAPDNGVAAITGPAGDLDAAAVANLLPDKPADDGTPLMVAALAALGLFLVGGAGWAWHHRTSRYFPA